MTHLYFFFIFFLGLAIGSFINCFVYRLHEGGSLWSRSFCPKCKKQIKWYDNIPVISFLFLRGKCRFCKRPISIQYPIVELISGILFVLAFFMNQEMFIPNIMPDSLFLIQLIRDWIIISVMIVIFIYDLKWFLILDVITIPASVIIFFVNILLGFSWQNLLISGIIINRLSLCFFINK